MPTKVKHICKYCGKTFFKTLSHHNRAIKRGDQNSFCSLQCIGKFEKQSRVTKSCLQCGKKVTKIKSWSKKYPNFFCSRSCSATYNNLHKTTGTRRSKLEVWIESQLKKLYPKIQVLFNDKTAINSELDIYIPSLKLAFELNGIYHYEPIHGAKKLSQVQNNDNRKFQACLEYGIDLCIIDSSGLKYFKEQNAQKYLGIVVDIIEDKLDS